MEFIFDKDGISYDKNKITYDVFEGEDANKELIKILINCINTEASVKFTCTDDCTPFGKLIKETLENEFSPKENDEV